MSAANDEAQAPEIEDHALPEVPDHDRFFLQHQQVVKARTGAYRSQRFVGKGGNGTTFLATAIDGPYAGVQFALKVFHKISNQKRRTAFLEEIEYYKRLEHPSITRFYDEGEYRVGDRVYPFVLVEYVPRSLQKLMIENSRRIERVTAMRIVLNIAAALRYLHEIPLVHRDIKPGNILISGEKARLADFGLAKSLEEAALDESEAVRDEMVYAAMPRFHRTPELVNRAKGDKSPLTPASDIYQLGTVFYEVLTGFNPQFPPEQLTDDIKLNLREIHGECGDHLYDLIRRMLAEQPDQRPTATNILDELLVIHRDYCFRMRDLTGQYV